MDILEHRGKKQPRRLGKDLVQYLKKHNSKDLFKCDFPNCKNNAYNTKSQVVNHIEQEHGPYTLFVYLRHHLVFKTDIVISVNAQTTHAQKEKGMSHIRIIG
jgi:hypothetical protein